MPSAPLKILILDDDADLRDQLSMACSGLGHQAAVVATAATALNRLNEESWDLLFTDVRMPDMDGLSLLRELGRRACPTRVVVISGHADEQITHDALQLGAVDFLAKPFGLAAIRRCLDRLTDAS